MALTCRWRSRPQHQKRTLKLSREMSALCQKRTLASWPWSRLITMSNLVGCSTGSSAGFAPRRISPGLLAWHIILVLAQPGRKRDPDSPLGEAPALGQIVEDHLGRVLVGDS